MGFCISFIIAVTCSYLIVCITKPKNFLTGFLYFILLTFAQIVLITELLSLFHLLLPQIFLGAQTLGLIAIVALWLKKQKPSFKETPLPTFKKILNNIKMDKALIALAFGWIFSLFIALFLAIVYHVTKTGDAEIYHVARSYFWVINHTINHFETSQVRMLAFPINSEILYSWIILFFNKAVCIGLISFTAYLTAISALYGIMDNFYIRRKLWVIFIVSAFANIIVQMSATETDIIVAALVLSSMYLFKEGLKTNTNTPLYFSALSYALAIGTKTTAFFLIPAVAIYFIYQSKKILTTKEYLKPFLIFLSFSCLNFILFASYNYISNFISFGNFLGAPNTIEFHKNYNGIKGAISTFTKTSFLLFDFTGLPHNKLLIAINNFLENKVLTFLSVEHIQNGINSTDDSLLNKTMFDTLMGTGVLGTILFIPSLLIALIKPIFAWTKNNKESFIFAIMFILTIAIMSSSIVFMTFNNRFLSTFILVCAPILGCTYFYKKSPMLKWIVTLFAIFYFTVISTHLWTRPFVKIFDALFIKKQTIEEINNRVTWILYDKNKDITPEELEMVNIIKTYTPETRILLFPNFNITKCRLAEEILKGRNISIKNIETFDFGTILDYDVIIYPIGGQSSNIAYRKDFIPNCSYKGRLFKKLENKYEKPCTCQCYIEDKYHNLLSQNNYRIDRSITRNSQTKYIIIKK